MFKKERTCGEAEEYSAQRLRQLAELARQSAANGAGSVFHILLFATYPW